MKINISYAASVANAPAGYKAAVQAAIAFFESTFTDPITINITFGYGDVGGYTLDADNIGAATSAGGYILSYAELRGALGASAHSTDDASAALSLPSTDPTHGGAFYIPSAQAKALGFVDGADPDVDGYVGLSSSLSFEWDPNVPIFNGKYDPVVVLKHEIGHVMGRIAYLGGVGPDGTQLFSAMDMFRYSGVGNSSVLDPTSPDGWFSINGLSLLRQFNNPTNGADPGDWRTLGSIETFNAFGATGSRPVITSTEYTLMDVLGLTIKDKPSFWAPSSLLGFGPSTASRLVFTVGQTPDLNHVYSVKNAAAGPTAYFKFDALNAFSVSPLFVYGSLVAFSDGPGDIVGADLIGMTPGSATVSKSGSMFVYGVNGSVRGLVVQTAAELTNVQPLEVVSEKASATGVDGRGVDLHLMNYSDLRVSAADQAIGVMGGRIDNYGVIRVLVTGASGADPTAIGVLNPLSFNNSRTIQVLSQSAADTIGVQVDATSATPLTNSGFIQADQAFLEKLAAPPAPGQGLSIVNSGRIIGSIMFDAGDNRLRNSGAIVGDIVFGDGPSSYDGTGGQQVGHIYLGAGSSQIILGADGEFVLDGGGSDLITGGAGADTVSYERIQGGVQVSLAVAGGQATGGSGTDALTGIENLVGGFGADELTGDGAANVLSDFEAGADILRGGGGADILSLYRSSTAAVAAMLLDGGDGADRLNFDGGVRYSDTATLQGGAGDDHIYAFGLGTGIISGGDGADLVTVDTLGGGYTVSLGTGADVLALAPTFGGFRPGPAVAVTDFDPADRLELNAYLDDALRGYTAGADPFASQHLRLVQVGADAVLQVDVDGAGDGFSDLVILKAVNAASLFPAALDGYLSNLLAASALVGSPAADALQSLPGKTTLQGLAGDDTLRGGAGADYLDGGSGSDTALYGGLYRAYAISAPAGAGTVGGGPEGGTDTLAGVERLKFVDGFLAVTTGDAAAQVYRIYGAALGRAPDATGLANWVGAIDQGGASLQTVAKGFINSPEFIARFGTGSDFQFLTLLYSNVLHRPPDNQGISNWQSFLRNNHTRAEVLTGFSESAEFVASTAPATQAGVWVGDPNAAIVARLYDTVFGRLPDASGEASWTAALQGGAGLNAVADGFVASTEFQTTYGPLSNDAFVRLMYQNVLHRAADQSGLDNWVGALNTGHSRAEVVIGFSESPEHVTNTAPHIDQGIWFA